jgi:hypothetical protein
MIATISGAGKSTIAYTTTYIPITYIHYADMTKGGHVCTTIMRRQRASC